MLLNPKKPDLSQLDERSAEIIRKTIAFFENKGLDKIKDDDRKAVWYQDFLDFLREEHVFADLLCPPQYGSENARWDTWRNTFFNEVLGFYGLPYWYTWQVTLLGLGPIWMSSNEAAKKKAARQLQDGEVFAFGLSEKEHGADVYSSDMTLTPVGSETWKASGSKYYIGNANVARMVSTFGKFADSEDYGFFVADSQRKEGYELVKNVVHSQSYVAEYKLNDYEVTSEEILHRGKDAWNAALNTVNVGKYNLGWATIGICTHAFYEALNHAANRHLYGMTVTDFPHVKQMFTEAYSRLVGMKLFARRTSDYLRTASADDRRYLLYDPLVKMQVTCEGEEVIRLMWDVIAAKGFEKDMYFEMAARDVHALPRLEGTVHVNVALILKFMPNFLFTPDNDLPKIGRETGTQHDEYLFNQGATRGLGKIRFRDYHEAFALYDTPNLKIFGEQVDALRAMLMSAAPQPEQQKDSDLTMTLGRIFSLIPYAQLLLESAKIEGLDDDLVDQIFDNIVRDMSKYALELISKQGLTDEQAELAQKMIRRPAKGMDRFLRVWEKVLAHSGTYKMND